MKKSIEGIVLQKIDYSENSIIIKFLSRDEGVVSGIFQGARSKKKKGNLISPLAILSIECYQRPESDLSRISSLEPEIVYKNIPYDPYKSAVIFFMNEVLNQTVHDKEDTKDLYDFIKNILQILDFSKRTTNFPVKFLFELTRYLGFFPEVQKNPRYFDLQEGTFSANQPNHPFYLSEEKSAVLIGLSGTKFDSIDRLKIESKIRKQLVHDLLSYYKIIFDNFKDIQSLPVLEATFHA